MLLRHIPPGGCRLRLWPEIVASSHVRRTGPTSSSYSTWEGTGSQEDFMLKDECITVDDRDAITGHASKMVSHRFVEDHPHGVLHRAFSVFLFDRHHRLLLQQRASSKITFPEVWTNTCCSHPLHGYHPTEVDQVTDVREGRVPGIRRAARRKLEHELGIPGSQIDLDAMRYLTRLLYCAADYDSTGTATGWGEHEMDYILFLRADVDLQPNPEEVMATRYVTPDELAAMMDPASGLKWSPWFRIIARHLLPRWWANLDGVLAGDAALTDWSMIHRL